MKIGSIVRIIDVSKYSYKSYIDVEGKVMKVKQLFSDSFGVDNINSKGCLIYFLYSDENIIWDLLYE